MMRHAEEKYSESAKTTDNIQEKTSGKEDAERAWTEIVNEACQKPIMKDMPFCPEESHAVP